MTKEREGYLRLEKVAKDSGTILFGVGEIGHLKESFDHLPEKICHDLNFGISFGVKVSSRILEEIEDHPTRLYMHHYRTLNILIDQIAIKLAGTIDEDGFDALPIPASQIVDWERQTAHLSHKMIARRAGLGWIGRNNLIINPRYGAAVRYGSILTNMPLTVDGPVEIDCGDCYRCLPVCPALAIKESYKDYDMASCLNKLKWFQRNFNIQHYICGICVKVCKGRAMGSIRQPDPVILFAGMIARDEGLFGLASKELKGRFGEVSYQSPIYPWNHSDYYEEEMGRDLKRQFIFFADPIMPDRISDIKIETNRIEGLFCREEDGKRGRMINIDPGYMSLAKIVLATTKDFSHRIYLRDGIYSEVTLIYQHDSYQPLPYTFPDFRSEDYIKLFNRIREGLRPSLKHIPETS